MKLIGCEHNLPIPFETCHISPYLCPKLVPVKTFVICRHAKADYPESTADIDRPLKERGYRDAARLGQLLADHGLEPDKIISSPALRARTTAEIVAENIDYEAEIEIRDEIYFGMASDIADILTDLPDDISTCMIFGHNPIVSEVVRLFMQSQHFYDLPTCAMACFESRAARWEQVSQHNSTLRWLLVPRLARKEE